MAMANYQAELTAAMSKQNEAKSTWRHFAQGHGGPPQGQGNDRRANANVALECKVRLEAGAKPVGQGIAVGQGRGWEGNAVGVAGPGCAMVSKNGPRGQSRVAAQAVPADLHATGQVLPGFNRPFSRT